MFVFNALGLRCVKFLKQIMKHILNTIRTCGQATLREALIMQVASLSSIVRDHLRPYISNIFDVIEEFWKTRHLETILLLVEKLSFAMPDYIRMYAPALVRLVLASFESARVSEWKEEEIDAAGFRIELVLRSIRYLTSKKILSGHLHLVVPQLVKLIDCLVLLSSARNISTESKSGYMAAHNLTLFAINTITILLTSTESSLYYAGTSYNGASTLSARTAQPLMRLLRNGRLDIKIGNAIIQLLCVCARNLGVQWIHLYHASTMDALGMWEKQLYFECVDDDQLSSRSSSVLRYNETVERINRNLDEGSRELSQGNHENQSKFKLTELSSFSKGTDDDFCLNLSSESPHMPSIMLRSSFHSIHQPSQLQVNQANLQRSWDVSQRSSREDWEDWIKRFSVQLLREAPSPALRAAADLAHAYQPLARELFPAAFLCCWLELSDKYRINLVQSLEVVFVADVSPDNLQILLNLAEFMEHDSIEGGFPIETSILAELAEKCRAYSKALHYKEQEYVRGSGAACIEALISINKKLELPEAALGILNATQMKFKDDYPPSSYIVLRGPGVRLEPGIGLDQANHWGGIRVKESWSAELGNWKDALALYEEKLLENPNDVNAILGCMRCYDARGDWRDVLDLASQSWKALATTDSNDSTLLRRRTSTNMLPDIDLKRVHESYKYISSEYQREAIKYCSKAAWRLGQWDSLEVFAAQLVRGKENSFDGGTSLSKMSQRGQTSSNMVVPLIDFDGAFFSAILHINRNEWTLAEDAIEAARRALDSSFTALMSESYKRAYPSMVTAQTLSELEEIIVYLKLEGKAKAGVHRHGPSLTDAQEARDRLLSTWRKRLSGCRVDAEVHSSIMAVRSLVLGPTDEVDATLQLSSLSRQAKCFKLSERILCDPLNMLGATLDSSAFGFNVPNNLDWIPGCSEQLSPKLLLSSNVVTDPSHYSEAVVNYCHDLVEKAGGVER